MSVVLKRTAAQSNDVFHVAVTALLTTREHVSRQKRVNICEYVSWLKWVKMLTNDNFLSW